jgi:hypothetical protein
LRIENGIVGPENLEASRKEGEGSRDIEQIGKIVVTA